VSNRNGSETIKVVRWIKGKYHLAVHNYSGDSYIAGCCAKIKFIYGQQKWQFQCPDVGTGKWWSVSVIDTNLNEVDIINKIIDQPW